MPIEDLPLDDLIRLQDIADQYFNWDEEEQPSG